MKKILTLAFVLCLALAAQARKTDPVINNPYEPHFTRAYALYPGIPRGTLEAVAFSNTRFTHLTHEPGSAQSCIGIPEAYGVMGLTLDGKNYFRNNLNLVAKVSGYSAEEIMESPEISILAYAKAYQETQARLNPALDATSRLARTLVTLSELPVSTELQKFALNTQLYGILTFLNDAEMQSRYKFPAHAHDLAQLFGAENLKVLGSSRVKASLNSVSDEQGNAFKSGNSSVQSADYAPAFWVASPNFNSRGGVAVSAVTIHTVQGSYAGCISWFQNTSSGVSAHYVVRSSDGQITQMVLESNRAWHVGSENGYTVGIEHEGYVSQTGWYTTNLYQQSALLVADICASHGIDPERTLFQPWGNTTYYNQSGIPGSCTKVKGHMHYPNQTHTDPGPNWDWNYFYMLVNNPAPGATVYNTGTGNFFDSGGAGANYSDDERGMWTIAPPGATNVTLTFSSFDLEDTWDYMYVYDGANEWAPLIGYYTGSTNPGTLIASSGTMTIEFRSDCATTGAGWNASWSSNGNIITPANLAITTASCPQDSVTLKWSNSGAGWYVDVTDDPSWGYFYNKAVPNATSVGCPGSFEHYTQTGVFLAFQPSTTYYWRVWDGTAHTYGNSFMTPACVYNDSNCAGTFDDTGGPGGPYSGNQDYESIIQPSNATSVTMNFTSFDLELNYDSMWIYNGAGTGSPLIGVYTGTVSPGTVMANSGVMTIRFKADPFVNEAGWTATWSCTQNTTGQGGLAAGGLQLAVYPNPVTSDATVSYSLSEAGRAEITVSDVLGKQLVLFNEQQSAGRHAFRLGAKQAGLGKGVYFVTLKTGAGQQTIRTIIE
jgi:N-acetyl-anhydromuramyl-L-alanine amidase AmpD